MIKTECAMVAKMFHLHFPYQEGKGDVLPEGAIILEWDKDMISPVKVIALVPADGARERFSVKDGKTTFEP